MPTGYGTAGHPFRRTQPSGHLYDGAPGIALFLAAISHVQGDEACRELSLRTIAPLRQLLSEWIAEDERPDRFGIGVGGLIGIGSFIYAFLRIGEWLDEPSLHHEAHELTSVLTAERISLDRQVRVQTGSAGAVLALLALQQKIPTANANGETPLDVASRCVERLLETQVPCHGFSGEAWPLSPGKPPLAGFSYGAAGICHALAEFCAASHHKEASEAARKGWSFVRSLYSPEVKSWRDPRIVFQSRHRLRGGGWKDWWASGHLEQLEPLDSPEAVEDRFLDIWCHGASGIALAQLEGIHAADSPEAGKPARDVLDRLCVAIRSRELAENDVDDICCGAMGQVEVLHRAYQELGNTEWLDSARLLADQVQRRAKARGRYTLSSARGRDVFAPSLFQGIAGVGYTLLRLAVPEALPSILLLE